MTDSRQDLDWSFRHQAVANHPGLVAALACCLAVISLIYSVTSLRIDTDTTDMIAEDVAFRQNELAFRDAFPAFKESILAVIDGDTPERSDDAARRLAAALKAEEQHFLRIDLPGDDPFFEQNGLLYLDLGALTSLSDRLARAQPLLAALASDPNLRGLADFIRLVLDEADDPAVAAGELDRLFNDMAKTVEASIEGQPSNLSWRRLLDVRGPLSSSRRLVLMEPTLDYSSLTPGADAIAKVRATAEQLGINQANGLKIRLTGSAVLEHEELEAASSGAIWAGLSAAAGVALLLILGLGSARLIIATLVTLVAGLIITAGIATLLVGRLNLISVTFAVLFVGLGVDFKIHLSLRYREALNRCSNHAAALGEALSKVGGPLTLSAVCAALGFIAFVPTDYQGLAELGIISAAGMVVAWAMSLTLLPALLNLMPLSPILSAGPAHEAKRPWTERYANIILGLALVLAVSAMPSLLKVSFDFNPLNLKDPASESVSTFLDLERNPETTANTINVLAANLAEADAMALRLNALPEIGDVITLSSFVPAEQADKLDVIDGMAFFLGTLGTDDHQALSAEARAAALKALLVDLERFADGKEGGLNRLKVSLSAFADKSLFEGDQLLDLEQRLTGHLRELLDQLDQALQAGPVDLDALPSSLQSQWINEKGQARLMARPAIGINDNRALARFADAGLRAVPEATGAPIIITQAGRAVVGAFIEASWIASALIIILLILILRRVRDVLLVLAPLALAVLFTAATSVFLGLQLNFANVIVLPLLLGLGVSGAIHMVMRRNQNQRSPLTTEPYGEAASTTSSTSRAVLFSALTTVASFGSLAISTHQGMASMGLLLTVAILWSLVCTLIILPALLSLFGADQALE